MEPASAILGIASGAATLVAMIGQTVSYLIDLCDSYRNARLAILDLMTNLQAFKSAWINIKEWTMKVIQADQTMQSNSTVEQLLAYVERSKLVVDLICEDLDRLGVVASNKKSPRRIRWWQNDFRPNARAAAQLVLHEKVISEHCERIHRQCASLNLLLLTIQLPSVPLQGAIVEAYQPVFRKDEETAWTIIQTRKTTKMKSRLSSRLSSICSDIYTSVATDPGPDNAPKSFAFDNELFLGPVYKRLLLAKLCESENKENVSKPADTRCSSPETSGNQRTNDSETRDNDASETVLEGYATTMWEHRIFSRSCTEDLLEFLERHRPRKLSRRHLPLAVANRQKGLDPEEQEVLNRNFLNAVQRRELEQIARALDQGANVNAELEGTTALQLCISEWYNERAKQPELPHESTTIAEFLLLYQETRIPYNFGGICNILHFCMHIGGNALLHQVIPSVGGLLERDIFGRTPLQTAVLCGDISIGCIKALRNIFPDDQLDPYRTVMKTAQDAGEFAESKRAMEHAEQFQKLAEGHKVEYVPETVPARPRTKTPNPFVPDPFRSPRIWITNPDPPGCDAD